MQILLLGMALFLTTFKRAGGRGPGGVWHVSSFFPITESFCALMQLTNFIKLNQLAFLLVGIDVAGF